MSKDIKRNNILILKPVNNRRTIKIKITRRVYAFICSDKDIVSNGISLELQNRDVKFSVQKFPHFILLKPKFFKF